MWRHIYQYICLRSSEVKTHIFLDSYLLIEIWLTEILINSLNTLLPWNPCQLFSALKSMSIICLEIPVYRLPWNPCPSSALESPGLSPALESPCSSSTLKSLSIICLEISVHHLPWNPCPSSALESLCPSSALEALVPSLSSLSLKVWSQRKTISFSWGNMIVILTITNRVSSLCEMSSA